MGASGVSIISLISAVTALVASIISPFVTISTAKRQINASVISANRTRWLESLREQLAMLVSELTGARILLLKDPGCTAAFERDRTGLVDRIEKLHLTNARIILMLNTHEPDHVELSTTVRSIVHDLRVINDSSVLEKRVDDAVDAIMNQSQQILKREWIRVKSGT